MSIGGSFSSQPHWISGRSSESTHSGSGYSGFPSPMFSRFSCVFSLSHEHVQNDLLITSQDGRHNHESVHFNSIFFKTNKQTRHFAWAWKPRVRSSIYGLVCLPSRRESVYYLRVSGITESCKWNAIARYDCSYVWVFQSVRQTLVLCRNSRHAHVIFARLEPTESSFFAPEMECCTTVW